MLQFSIVGTFVGPYAQSWGETVKMTCDRGTEKKAVALSLTTCGTVMTGHTMITLSRSQGRVIDIGAAADRFVRCKGVESGL